MTKTNFQLQFKRIICGFSATALILVYFPGFASAAQITARKVTIGSSVASASTTYSFTFTVPSATAIQSVDFAACTTASGTCTTPSGFSSSFSTLTAQPTNLGAASGWTVSAATAGSLRLSNGSNVTAPSSSQTVGFSSVTNPSATNSTYFFRITTYSGSNWSTGPIDTGNVAASTAGQITVTASVDETLTMTLASATVALGTLSTSATGSGTSTVILSTNAATGYSLTYTGTTLTSGSNTITALSSQGASAVNNKQFGLNAVSNSAPSVGSNVSGSGSGAAATGYSTTNQFKFLTGDTIASASLPTNTNTFTISYIANIDGSTAAGSYQTVLTYVATANF